MNRGAINETSGTASPSVAKDDEATTTTSTRAIPKMSELS